MAPGTVTMSSRGTMTSRATVSPNSMIDSMSSRSSCSITSSSTATSANASSSSWETNGPFFKPLPGRITFVMPMSPRATIRIGGKATSAATGLATNSADRSGCWSAHVFGAASAKTNTITTLKMVAMMMPIVPNSRSDRIPTSVAWTSWHTRSTSSSGLRNRSGWPTRRSSALPRRGCSSASVIALTLFMRVSAVSAMAT